jgi:hypothetical protein
MFDRQDPEEAVRVKERTLRVKRNEQAIYATVLELYPDLRFQKLLELVADYRRFCLDQMATEKVTDLRQLGVFQGRAQGLAWLAEQRSTIIRKAESLDREIQGLEHDLESANKPLGDRMADTTVRSH